MPSLESEVANGFTTAHAAASVAARICQEFSADTSGGEVLPLVVDFKRAVLQAGLESTLLPGHMEYAERLATSPRLLYEEMHKLFSLCEEVLAFRSLGYEVGTDSLDRHVATVSAKLQAERSVALLVAEDLGLTADHTFWEMSGLSIPD